MSFHLGSSNNFLTMQSGELRNDTILWINWAYVFCTWLHIYESDCTHIQLWEVCTCLYIKLYKVYIICH